MLTTKFHLTITDSILRVDMATPTAVPMKPNGQSLFYVASLSSAEPMTLETFRLWSGPALKVYLSLPKKSVEGSFDELAARYDKL